MWPAAAVRCSGSISSGSWRIPEVYVLILPGLGIIAEVVANNTRRPMWGYKAAVFAVIGIGFLSFIVWAHHMYLTGMGAAVSTFFQTTTIMISVPSVIILTCLLLSLWGGSIRFTVPMLFATAFLPEFGIGGLTGIPLAFNSTDLYLHDTYYIIAHFHYIVAPGTIFAIFAGVYYWFPKATGRMMNEFLGKVHFWGSVVSMNMIFFPMFLQGMAGMHRRGFDGGATYDLAKPVLHWNTSISHAAWTLGLFQLPFIFNFFWSIKYGKKVGKQSVECHHARVGRAFAAAAWQLPRAGGRLPRPVRIQRARASAWTSSRNATRRVPGPTPERTATRFILMEIPYTVSARPDTGLYNAKIGIWLFLASEVMLFGGLVLRLCVPAARRAAWLLAARPAECAGGHDEYGDPDRLVGDGGAGLGFAEDAAVHAV